MKKTAAFLTSFALIASVGCSAESSSSQIKAPPQEITVSQTLYSYSPFSLGDDVDSVWQIETSGDMCYVFYSTKDEKIKLAKLDTELNIKETVNISASDPSRFTVDDEGNIYSVDAATDFVFKYDDDGEITNMDEYYSSARFTYTLTHYDASGNVLEKHEIEGLGDYSGTFQGCGGFVRCGNGNFLIALDGIALVSEDGELIDFGSNDSFGIRLGETSDGRAVMSFKDSFYYLMDGTTAKVSKKDEHQCDIDLSSSIIKGSGDFIFCFTLHNGLYGVAEGCDPVLLVDFERSMLNECEKIAAFGQNRFIVSKGSELGTYNIRPEDFTDSRKALKIWQIDSGGGIDDLVKEFNRSSDSYVAEVTELVTQEELKNAVLTGNVPDIITGDITLANEMSGLGAFADIYELMDTYGGLSREDFMPNILKASEIDGKLYSVGTHFNVSVFIADKSFIGEEYKDWSIGDFLDIYDNRPEGMELMLEEIPFTSLISSNIEAWVDKENAKCSFDSEEFRRLLEICRDFDKENEEYITYDEEFFKKKMTVFKDRKLMCDKTDIGGCGSLLSTSGQFGMGFDDISLLNAPGRNGRGQVRISECMSVLAGSENKEAAWEFINSAFENSSREYVTGTFFLTLKKQFEEHLAKHTDSDGVLETAKGTVNDIQYEFVSELTEKQAQELYDLILRCDTLDFTDQDIYSVLTEEYGRFVGGETTAEQCAKLIQDRVEILLSERQ